METKKTPGAAPAKTIGPVANLEHHLHPEWWKRIFNSLYLKTDGDVVEDALITAAEIDMFGELLGIREGDTLLDLACGQGRHLIELARRGKYQLFGLDRSRYLIQRARSNAKKGGLVIQFKEGDVRKLPYATDSFDFVTILGNSFGYFESPDDDVRILSEVFRVLKPEGKLLMDVADGNYLKDRFVPRSWEWMDKKHFVCRERSLAKDGRRLISREVITHT
ncbi:MAG: class I SAM-dependent methyltransferase, partial [Sinomicrobium sp.]|nr:class I SAM-dependent methyltransferase [Sinomicrobium sp.]